MNASRHFLPTCASCGDRIGVYEPLWLQTVDGAIVGASVLELRERSPADARSCFHAECLSPDEILQSGTA